MENEAMTVDVNELQYRLDVYERIWTHIGKILKCVEEYHDSCMCRSRMAELKAVMDIKGRGQALYCRCTECGFRSIVFTAGEYQPIPGKFVCYECWMAPPSTRPAKCPAGHDRFQLLDLE